MGRCFLCAGVSVLQGRFMLAAPVIWGLWSTMEAFFLDFPSPSRCLRRLSRCCFRDDLHSRSCYPPFLAVYGFQAVWQCHSRPWSGTWFRAQFLSNRLGVTQNGSKPTSQMALFTPNRGQFSEFLNECGEILSRTDMVLPDLVLAVFWVVAQISAFWDGSCPSVHV